MKDVILDFITDCIQSTNSDYLENISGLTNYHNSICQTIDDDEPDLFN